MVLSSRKFTRPNASYFSYYLDNGLELDIIWNDFAHSMNEISGTIFNYATAMVQICCSEVIQTQYPPHYLHLYLVLEI